MQFDQLNRREVMMLLGGAAATWPLAARAQQPATPVIGFLGTTSLENRVERLGKFRQALKETGHVEGENVAIEYRWADGQYDRLPALAGELVRFSTELVTKRLELLRELVPGVARVAVIVNPADTTSTETMLRDLEPAARALGWEIRILKADTSGAIDAAFATLARERPDALFVGSSPFFTSRRIQLVQLGARHALPATYVGRQYAEVGGLMSYGANLNEAWRQLGLYTGRVLKGAKPADLPVVQASKFELVINHQTARMLDLTVPPTLLALADEVIE